MKITAINTIKMTLPTDVWLLLTVETDQGLTGWGEVTGSLDDEGLGGIVARCAEGAVGKNPLHIPEVTAFFRDWTYPVSDTVRTFCTAVSGLDQALWDISAQAKGLPLYQLLGGQGKQEIPLYANLNKALRADRSLESLENNAHRAVESGFTVLKCTPFDEISPAHGNCPLESAFQRISAVLTAADMSTVALDCHQRFRRHTLGRMIGQLLERFGQPFWVEDPVDAADFHTMNLMQHAYPGVRWAAGEDALNLRQLHAEVVSDCYEVLMPDIKYIGGPSAVRAAIPYLEALNIGVSLHNPNGVIATAHSAHLSSLCRSGLPLEFAFGAVPNREELCTQPERIENGQYLLAQSPGIGVSLSKEALKEYAEIFSNGVWHPYSVKLS